MAAHDRRRNETIRSRIRWTFVLAISLLLACSDATGPTSPLPFQLFFTMPPAATYSGPSIVGASTKIVVTARLVAPTPCTDVTATVNHDAAAIDITMTASQKSGVCVQSLGLFDYTLVLAPIAPGTYHVTVHHVGEAGGTNSTFAQDVTVPG